MTLHCRINLKKTNYLQISDHKILWARNYKVSPDTDKLLQIYKQYCDYKQFESPLHYYKEQFTHENFEVLGYYDNKKLVAWSLIYIINKEIAEAYQFAWDYKNPELRLGIASLTNECALYKNRGFKYLMLNEVNSYKEAIDGFELLPPLG